MNICLCCCTQASEVRVHPHVGVKALLHRHIVHTFYKLIENSSFSSVQSMYYII